MTGHIDRLRQRHRRIDRLIDTTKAAGRQDEVKTLKRIRLRLKDRIAILSSQREQVPA